MAQQPAGAAPARRGTRRALAALGGLAGVAGLVLVGWGVAGQQPAPPAAVDIPAVSASPLPTSTTAPTSGATASVKRRTPATGAARVTPPVVLAESEPVHVTIPSIQVSSGFEDLGIGGNGEMAAPVDPDKVGWFSGAHTPGAPGVGVLAGHVTWNRRPTVFFRLGDLKRDDQITVRRQDGSTAVFAVTRMSTIPKNRFPSAEVYRATDVPELVLITCGGRYSWTHHSYDSNLIVWARVLSVHQA